MKTEPKTISLSFTNLKQLLVFHETKLNKSMTTASKIIQSMSDKGQMSVEPDGVVVVTWFFRDMIKYNKLIDNYIEFNHVERERFVQPRKTYVEMISQ